MIQTPPTIAKVRRCLVGVVVVAVVLWAVWVHHRQASFHRPILVGRRRRVTDFFQFGRFVDASSPNLVSCAFLNGRPGENCPGTVPCGISAPVVIQMADGANAIEFRDCELHRPLLNPLAIVVEPEDGNTSWTVQFVNINFTNVNILVRSPRQAIVNSTVEVLNSSVSCRSAAFGPFTGDTYHLHCLTVEVTEVAVVTGLTFRVDDGSTIIATTTFANEIANGLLLFVNRSGVTEAVVRNVSWVIGPGSRLTIQGHLNVRVMALWSVDATLVPSNLSFVVGAVGPTQRTAFVSAWRLSGGGLDDFGVLCSSNVDTVNVTATLAATTVCVTRMRLLSFTYLAGATISIVKTHFEMFPGSGSLTRGSSLLLAQDRSDKGPQLSLSNVVVRFDEVHCTQPFIAIFVFRTALRADFVVNHSSLWSASVAAPAQYVMGHFFTTFFDSRFVSLTIANGSQVVSPTIVTSLQGACSNCRFLISSQSNLVSVGEDDGFAQPPTVFGFTLSANGMVNTSVELLDSNLTLRLPSPPSGAVITSVRLLDFESGSSISPMAPSFEDLIISVRDCNITASATIGATPTVHVLSASNAGTMMRVSIYISRTLLMLNASGTLGSIANFLSFPGPLYVTGTTMHSLNVTVDNCTVIAPGGGTTRLAVIVADVKNASIVWQDAAVQCRFSSLSFGVFSGTTIKNALLSLARVHVVSQWDSQASPPIALGYASCEPAPNCVGLLRVSLLFQSVSFSSPPSRTTDTFRCLTTWGSQNETTLSLSSNSVIDVSPTSTAEILCIRVSIATAIHSNHVISISDSYISVASVNIVFAVTLTLPFNVGIYTTLVSDSTIVVQRSVVFLGGGLGSASSIAYFASLPSMDLYGSNLVVHISDSVMTFQQHETNCIAVMSETLSSFDVAIQHSRFVIESASAYVASFLTYDATLTDISAVLRNVSVKANVADSTIFAEDLRVLSSRGWLIGSRFEVHDASSFNLTAIQGAGQPVSFANYASSKSPENPIWIFRSSSLLCLADRGVFAWTYFPATVKNGTIAIIDANVTTTTIGDIGSSYALRFAGASTLNVVLSDCNLTFAASSLIPNGALTFEANACAQIEVSLYKVDLTVIVGQLSSLIKVLNFVSASAVRSTLIRLSLTRITTVNSTFPAAYNSPRALQVGSRPSFDRNVTVNMCNSTVAVRNASTAVAHPCLLDSEVGFVNVSCGSEPGGCWRPVFPTETATATSTVTTTTDTTSTVMTATATTTTITSATPTTTTDTTSTMTTGTATTITITSATPTTTSTGTASSRTKTSTATATLFGTSTGTPSATPTLTGTPTLTDSTTMTTLTTASDVNTTLASETAIISPLPSSSTQNSSNATAAVVPGAAVFTAETAVTVAAVASFVVSPPTTVTSLQRALAVNSVLHCRLPDSDDDGTALDPPPMSQFPLSKWILFGTEGRAAEGAAAGGDALLGRNDSWLHGAAAIRARLVIVMHIVSAVENAAVLLPLAMILLAAASAVRFAILGPREEGCDCRERAASDEDLSGRLDENSVNDDDDDGAALSHAPSSTTYRLLLLQWNDRTTISSLVKVAVLCRFPSSAVLPVTLFLPRALESATIALTASLWSAPALANRARGLSEGGSGDEVGVSSSLTVAAAMTFSATIICAFVVGGLFLHCTTGTRLKAVQVDVAPDPSSRVPAWLQMLASGTVTWVPLVTPRSPRGKRRRVVSWFHFRYQQLYDACRSSRAWYGCVDWLFVLLMSMVGAVRLNRDAGCVAMTVLMLLLAVANLVLLLVLNPYVAPPAKAVAVVTSFLTVLAAGLALSSSTADAAEVVVAVCAVLGLGKVPVDVLVVCCDALAILKRPTRRVRKPPSIAAYPSLLDAPPLALLSDDGDLGLHRTANDGDVEMTHCTDLDHHQRPKSTSHPAQGGRVKRQVSHASVLLAPMQEYDAAATTRAGYLMGQTEGLARLVDEGGEGRGADGTDNRRKGMLDWLLGDGADAFVDDHTCEHDLQEPRGPLRDDGGLDALLNPLAEIDDGDDTSKLFVSGLTRRRMVLNRHDGGGQKTNVVGALVDGTRRM